MGPRAEQLYGLRDAHTAFHRGDVERALLLSLWGAHQGSFSAHANAIWLLVRRPHQSREVLKHLHKAARRILSSLSPLSSEAHNHVAAAISEGNINSSDGSISSPQSMSAHSPSTRTTHDLAMELIVSAQAQYRRQMSSGGAERRWSDIGGAVQGIDGGHVGLLLLEGDLHLKFSGWITLLGGNLVRTSWETWWGRGVGGGSKVMVADAVRCYEASARAGNVRAMQRLALLFAMGTEAAEGVHRDLGRAEALVREALHTLRSNRAHGSEATAGIAGGGRWRHDKTIEAASSLTIVTLIMQLHALR